MQKPSATRAERLLLNKWFRMQETVHAFKPSVSIGTELYLIVTGWWEYLLCIFLQSVGPRGIKLDRVVPNAIMKAVYHFNGMRNSVYVTHNRLVLQSFHVAIIVCLKVCNFEVRIVLSSVGACNVVAFAQSAVQHAISLAASFPICSHNPRIMELNIWLFRVCCTVCDGCTRLSKCHWQQLENLVLYFTHAELATA